MRTFPLLFTYLLLLVVHFFRVFVVVVVKEVNREHLLLSLSSIPRVYNKE